MYYVKILTTFSDGQIEHNNSLFLTEDGVLDEAEPLRLEQLMAALDAWTRHYASSQLVTLKSGKEVKKYSLEISTGAY